MQEGGHQMKTFYDQFLQCGFEVQYTQSHDNACI